MKLLVWRHPKPRVAPGVCLGRSDVAVDRRKAKRLAHRIRSHARRHGLERSIVTSRLRRSAAVGEVLACWGWRHRIDARLDELDFGRWDGRSWADIGEAELSEWTRDFAQHRPGGGESVSELLARCREFVGEFAGEGERSSVVVCAVGHAGWISAATLWAQAGRNAPFISAVVPTADRWPRAVGYGSLTTF